LIVTHDHQRDEDILALAVARPHAYIGLVGSRRKVLRLVDRVRARHGSEVMPLGFERVYAPVGLDLGALTPEEIAVSIVAEWVALRRGKRTRHLSVVGGREDECTSGGRCVAHACCCPAASAPPRFVSSAASSPRCDARPSLYRLPAAPRSCSTSATWWCFRVSSTVTCTSTNP